MRFASRKASASIGPDGGFVVPQYLGSKATFTLGLFGGHVGRALRTGDVLRLSDPDVMRRFMQSDEAPDECAPAPAALIPKYGNRWKIAVTLGPHGAPDFFTEEDIRAFYDAEWEVHYNSSRTGVRLIGPKPEWARTDGGEAGLHPSNVHDNAYAVGAVDYTGDMPVILGPDGPSLGGFVCPAIVALSDLWKLGQLRPGDRIRFYCISVEAAVARRQVQDELITGLELPHGVIAGSGDAAVDDVESVQDTGAPLPMNCVRSPVLHAAGNGNDAICVRQSGEDYILIEFGPPVLDLELRFRVHALMQALDAQRLSAIIDLTPGIRSLQVHYDSRALSQAKLLDIVLSTQASLPALEELEVPSRIVHLPLSWDDPATRLAIEKYMQSVRADAPWCPSNIEFIRRINGLDSIEDVKRIVFDASYLVMGLGDVYLGAPVATPLDPRHRLVTTKYNPARTWTPENAVGIGGAYLCIYGMEGPGGYQFVGRTLQVYNRFHTTPLFSRDQPWLLRFFDQIQFYPVSAAELLEMREAFLHGKVELDVQHDTFRLSAYERFLSENSESIQSFKASQQAAFEAERQRWVESGQLGFSEAERTASGADRSDAGVPDGAQAVESHVPGSVWKLMVERGARVRKGDPLVVVESMKMEVCVEAPEDGTVLELLVSEGKSVAPGQHVAFLRPEPR